MKQITKSFVLLLALTIAFAGCSGSNGPPPAPKETVTSPITKEVADASSPSYSAMPFGDTTAAHTMIIYTPAQMKGAGNIKSISFKYNDNLTTAVSCPHTTIKMSHTHFTGLSTTFANNINQGEGSQTTVLSDTTVSIPAGTAGTYYTIPLSTPFIYDGEESLVVEVERNACTGTVNTVNHDTAVGSKTVFASDTTSLSGTPEVWIPDTKFGVDGGDSAVAYSGPGGNTYPFGSPGRKIQLLYTAAEINGSGVITGIGFPVGNNPTTPGESATVTVTLGHNTSSTGLTSIFASNFNSGASVVVANAQTFTIPAGIPYGTYIWIPIPDGTFTYNGTDNLVVQIETSNITGTTTTWLQANSGTNTRVYGTLGDLTVTTGTPDLAQYLIKFRFAGAPVHFITGANDSDVIPFTSDASGGTRQLLYRSAELGAKGTITKIAHRLENDASAGTYNTLTVKLANTDLTALGTSFSTNMPSSTTVYSGTYSIPSTLKAGDWIEIPLTTTFTYDPTKNLLVQISDQSGDANNPTRGKVDGTRFPSRRAEAPDYTVDTAVVNNFLADFRLIVE